MPDTATLLVKEIFLTIQGEGPFVGQPAVFVRLGSCNLACPKCDTDFRSNAEELPVGDVVMRILDAGPSTRLVVITGGEPFKQNLDPLLDLLTQKDLCRRVQIETNGTLPPTKYFMDVLYPSGLISIVCSPKAPKINREIELRLAAYKYVIEAGEIDPTDGLPTKCFGGMLGRPARPRFEAPVYLQPCDDRNAVKNDLNLQAAITSCLEHGHTLCLQTHKIIGLR